MTDEEKNDQTTEEQTDAEATEAPAEDAAPVEEASDQQEPQAEEAAPADEAEAEAAPAADAAEAPEAAADDGGGDAAPADDAEEGLDWKTRKRLAKSRESGEAGPQLSPEDRAAARTSDRVASAKSRSAYRAKQRSKHEKGIGTEPVERESAGRKERRGYVVSDKADKTITVRIDVARRHRRYEKIVRTSDTLHAHDERNEAGEGDLVKIVETRPLSKTKRWRLVEVMEKAK